MPFEFLPFISSVFGWIYTLCWSLSFYPQPMLNWRRKSTSGTTIDFPLINCLGFLAYLVSNTLFYSSPLVRAQYASRNHDLAPTVQFNDITFAFHALLLSLLITSQYWRHLWGFTPSLGARPSRFVLGIGAGCVFGVVVTVLIVLSSPNPSAVGPEARKLWIWLDVVYAISYVKLLVTLIKYTPQVVTNWRNRSTQGWSIAQILLDFTGGGLSIAQLAIDSYLQRDWAGITGNPVKLALGNVSIVYDFVFMTQHFVLYRDGKGKEAELEGLLTSEEDEQEEEERGRRRI